MGESTGGSLELSGAVGLSDGTEAEGEPDPGPSDPETGGWPLVSGLPLGCPTVPSGGDFGALGCALAESDGLAEAEGPSEASGEAVPAEALGTPADGAASSGSGVVARRAGGAEDDTPGCSIGAIGGFFGNGSGVMPDTQA